MAVNTQAVQANGGGAVKALTVEGLLRGNESFKAKIAAALPKHLSAERYMRIVNNTVLRTPKLLRCNPASFSNALLLLSQYGLEPDGRRAHLIPFENKKAGTVELQLIIDWKGLAELILRSGVIARLHADLICENDDFEFDMGDILHHKIDFRKERGEPYAVYAMAVTKTGERFVQVLQRSEVESVRNGSSGWQAFVKGYAKQSPWDDKTPVSRGEMWKKTAFRRLAKWLPLSSEIREAVELDDDESPMTATAAGLTQIPESTGGLVATAGEADELPAPEEDDVPMGDEAPAQEQEIAQAKPAKVEKPKPAPTPEPEPAVSHQDRLSELVMSNGFTFDHLVEWGDESGAIPNATSLSGFADVSSDLAKRLVNSKAGLLRGLAAVKGGAK